jgi:hypothetical protein
MYNQSCTVRLGESRNSRTATAVFGAELCEARARRTAVSNKDVRGFESWCHGVRDFCAVTVVGCLGTLRVYAMHVCGFEARDGCFFVTRDEKQTLHTVHRRMPRRKGFLERYLIRSLVSPHSEAESRERVLVCTDVVRLMTAWIYSYIWLEPRG